MKNKETTEPAEPATQTPALVAAKEIPLSEIGVLAQPRTEFDDAETKELAASISKHGVLQAILTRPWPDNVPNPKKFKYHLVFGERRLRASTIAKKSTIPTMVRQLTDAEVLDIQIVENLQREDISALDEAAWFKHILSSSHINVEELGQRIGKAKDYINRRLHLNDMIAPFRKLLHDKEMLLVHAFEITKLPAHEQTNYYNDLKKENALKLIHLQTATQLREDIEQKIVRSLDGAQFKASDDKLLPEAGACTNCLKRSGANRDLFGDMKEQDRCFDKTCFEKKTNIAFDLKLKAAIEDPDTLLICGWYESDDIVTRLRKEGHTILKEWTDYSDATKSTPGAKKAFYVASRNKGQTIYIKLKSKVEPGKKSPAQISLAIQAKKEDGLKTDQKIILDKIAKKLEERPEYKDILDSGKFKTPGSKITPAENTAALLLLMDSVAFRISGALPIKDDYEKIANESAQVIANITRAAVFNFVQFASGANSPMAKAALQLLGKSFFPKDVEQFEKEQLEVRKSREAKLDAKANPVAKKKAAKPVPAAKPAPANKKVTSTMPAKKSVQPSPAVKNKAPRTQAAFMQALQPSAALAVITGNKPLPRTEVTKKVWDYMKKHKLQDQKDKRNINCDAALEKVFGKKVVSMFEMAKGLNNNLTTVKPAKKK
jgi:ParB/RepB/Spo0J family partition protein